VAGKEAVIGYPRYCNRYSNGALGGEVRGRHGGMKIMKQALHDDTASKNTWRRGGGTGWAYATDTRHRLYKAKNLGLCRLIT